MGTRNVKVISYRYDKPLAGPCPVQAHGVCSHRFFSIFVLCLKYKIYSVLEHSNVDQFEINGINLSMVFCLESRFDRVDLVWGRFVQLPLIYHSKGGNKLLFLSTFVLSPDWKVTCLFGVSIERQKLLL